MKFHDRLKYYRKIKKLSQVSLANAAGLKVQLVRSIEIGESQVSLPEAAQLAEALSTTLDALWYGTEFQSLHDDYDRFRAIRKLPYRDQVALLTVIDRFLDSSVVEGNWKTSNKSLKARKVHKK